MLSYLVCNDDYCASELQEKYPWNTQIGGLLSATVKNPLRQEIVSIIISIAEMFCAYSLVHSCLVVILSQMHWSCVYDCVCVSIVFIILSLKHVTNQLYIMVPTDSYYHFGG